MNGKINDKQKSDDRTIEKQMSEDRHLTKINSWRTAWRSLWRNFSLTKISCYTVEKYGIHWTSTSHKLDVGSNFNANATCRKFAWHRCTPMGSCKDQVLGNRHRPGVYASSRAATFSVGLRAPFTRRRCENDRYEIVPIRKEIFPDRPPVYTKTIRIRKLLKTIRRR